MIGFWKYLLLILMSLVIIVVWIMDPPQGILGDISRIFYFHVPAAWIAVLAFAVGMFNSIRYLKSRKIEYDMKSAASAELGLIFGMLAAISGAFFSKYAWGTYWNWDPRQTSIFILILIYGAYLALRSALDSEERRAVFSGVYSILAFITVPFLVFVVPRIYPSLHPSDTIIVSNMEIRLILLLSLCCFTILFFWLYKLRIDIEFYIRHKTRMV